MPIKSVYSRSVSPGSFKFVFSTTPPEIINEFNTLVFHFLWNGKDKVTRRSTYAPNGSGGIKTVDYESMVKALR